jgi:hypothetical protein
MMANGAAMTLFILFSKTWPSLEVRALVGRLKCGVRKLHLKKITLWPNFQYYNFISSSENLHLGHIELKLFRQAQCLGIAALEYS